VVRIGRAASFGRAMLFSAVDKRPVGMVASATRYSNTGDRFGQLRRRTFR